MTSRMKCESRATRLRKPSRIAPLPASLGNRSISHPPALLKSVVTSSVRLANAAIARVSNGWGMLQLAFANDADS